MKLSWQTSWDRLHPEATAQWRDEQGEVWQVTLAWTLIRGRWELASFHVEGLKGKQPLTASLLRTLPVVQLASDALGAHREQEEKAGATWRAEMEQELSPRWEREVARELQRRRQQFEDPHKRGRPGHPPDHYAEVARVYAAAYVSGENPTAAVAERYKTSNANAAKWVSKARRKYGFLEPTPKGRAGGVPTKGRKR